MTYLQQLQQWSSRHPPKWFVVPRVILGVTLIVKGIQFIKDSTHLEQLLQKIPSAQNISWFNTFIPWLHFLGGSLIVAGLFTRISCVLQIPVLLGAVFFATNPGSADFIFSLIILLLLFFFFVEGGGPYSIDNARLKQKL
jgi:putative oxidoreductase